MTDGDGWLEGGIRRRLGQLLPDLGFGRLDGIGHGMRAVYLGQNRLLVRITVGARRLAFVVDADDRLLTPWFVASGRYEVELTRYLRRTVRPGQHCIDVGANFGYFSVLMARLCRPGRLIGLEPDARVAGLALDNLRINGLDRWAEVRAAAATADGVGLRLFRRVGRSGNTSLVESPIAFTELMGEPPVEPFDAPGVTVDALLPELDGRVDLIKIDVEGAETQVLAGAAETLATSRRLRIVMEWSPEQLGTLGAGPDDVRARLEPHGFRPFRLTRHRSVALSWDALAAMPYQAAVLFRR